RALRARLLPRALRARLLPRALRARLLPRALRARLLPRALRARLLLRLQNVAHGETARARGLEALHEELEPAPGRTALLDEGVQVQVTRPRLERGAGVL